MKIYKWQLKKKHFYSCVIYSCSSIVGKTSTRKDKSIPFSTTMDQQMHQHMHQHYQQQMQVQQHPVVMAQSHNPEVKSSSIKNRIWFSRKHSPAETLLTWYSKVATAASTRKSSRNGCYCPSASPICLYWSSFLQPTHLDAWRFHVDIIL